MSDKPENPPAFPNHPGTNLPGAKIPDWGGMTLRDWFAGQALLGIGQEYLHRNGFHGDTLPANLAVHAYRVADAMLAARSHQEQVS